MGEIHVDCWQLLAIDDKLCSMRIWSLHPRYLDTKGLLAVWREGLLAQKVLLNQTRGYRNHPQLKRFLSAPDPVAAIGTYLQAIYDEAVNGGYRFNANKITQAKSSSQIPCTRGQLIYEWNHLLQKLKQRDGRRYQETEGIGEPEPHPLFYIINGDTEDWEIRTTHS